MPRDAARGSVQELCQFFESVRKETRQKSFSSDNLTSIGTAESDNRPPLHRRLSFSSSDSRAKFINNFLAFETSNQSLKDASFRQTVDGTAVDVDSADVADEVPRASGSVTLHQPIIRKPKKDRFDTQEQVHGHGKNPLLRMFSNHCGLENKIRLDHIRNNVRSERNPQRHRKVSQTTSVPLEAMSSNSRSGWANPSADSQPRPKPSMVSTASIRLSKQNPSLGIKRLSWEDERTISVIQTAGSLPRMAAESSSPLLDKWLCSLVKQPPEEMESGEEQLFPRHHYAALQPWAGSTIRRRQSSDGEFDRRSSADSGRHSEAKSVVLEHASDAGVSIHLTEDDDYGEEVDSVCLQSVSDTASVQLCVPGWEEPRQHLPLSPCSSVGSASSVHSARSSNADSAVDLAVSEDDTIEIEVYTYRSQAARGGQSVHYKQAMFAKSKLSSTSSSSSGHTVVEPAAASVPLRGQGCRNGMGPVPPVAETAWRVASGVPSLIISDHSTCGPAPPQDERAAAWRDCQTAALDTLQLHTHLHRTSSSSSVTSVTSGSTEDSLCSSCWTDSSASDDELPSARRRRVSTACVR